MLLDDAIEYRDKINSNIQKVYNLIDNKLRIKRKDIPEGFVDQFVVDWVVGEPDERLLTIELASFSEDFVVEFGPMSVNQWIGSTGYCRDPGYDSETSEREEYDNMHFQSYS